MQIERRFCRKAMAAGFVLALLSVVQAAPAVAQGAAEVQELTGHIRQGDFITYSIPGLKQGQKLYVSVQGTSGNLDPWAGIVSADVDVKQLAVDFRTRFDRAVAEGQDPYVVVPELADELFLAWDDDSGKGYSVALEFTVPASGSYLLVVLSSLLEETFGNYRLLVGLDAPEVLTGEAKPTGDVIAVLDRDQSRIGTSVKRVSGNLSAGRELAPFVLLPLYAGDTLYVYLETTSGNLAPEVRLNDYGGKTLRSASAGPQSNATLQYTFEEGGDGYSLVVTALSRDGEPTAGSFRILAGLNAPEALTGEAAVAGPPIFQEPARVDIGIKLQQITGIDQVAENYAAVASMRMDWSEPGLAFSPDTCRCDIKIFTASTFSDFVSEVEGRWPDFTIFNQQGNRWTQNRVVTVRPEGNGTYFERFWTTFQAPDFNFRKFPFDSQVFRMRIDLLFPEYVYFFSDLGNFTEVGGQLGEEEWYVTSFNTEVSTIDSEAGFARSRFTFNFEARRHLTYYIFRILLPLVIIVSVSWATFFLRDYVRRIEVAGANLLLFIAFNFTIAGNLPRLGYLTFMDTILIGIFAVTAATLIFNIVLKRLEIDKRGELAASLDRYTVWIYPAGYVVLFGILYLFFFM